MDLLKRIIPLILTRRREGLARVPGGPGSHPGSERAAAAAVERRGAAHGLLRSRLRGPRPL